MVNPGGLSVNHSLDLDATNTNCVQNYEQKGICSKNQLIYLWISSLNKNKQKFMNLQIAKDIAKKGWPV